MAIDTEVGRKHRSSIEQSEQRRLIELSPAGRRLAEADELPVTTGFVK